ncbi:hypothetical protein KCU61_g1145, partial [Aureobasidium melanogenum]
MKDLGLILMLTLLGSMGVLAAPVEQYTQREPKSLLSSWLSRVHPIHTKHDNSSDSTSYGPFKVSIRTHEADVQNVKTKTETRIVTEDCSATDDMVRTTIVEMVPSTRVLEYTPSYRTTKTVIQTVLYDVTKTASSTRSHRPTKHTLTETVISPSPTTSKSSRKHTRSKKHTRSSNTTVSPFPSSSVSPSSSSMSVVVVTTSEVVEVVTVGYTEVTSTMTLTEGDSRLSSTTQTSSTGSSSAANPFTYPILFTELPTLPSVQPGSRSADEIAGDVRDMATSDLSPIPTSFSTIHHNATSKTYPPVDVISHYTTTPAELPAKTQGADDDVVNLSARDDDDDDPDHDYKKYRKPDKAMSKRMSRWSKHHSKSMEKQSSYKQEARAKSRSLSAKSADKASRKKHHHDDDDCVASAGLAVREVSMAAPATTYVEVTVTTTVLPTQNGTYSISFRTVHASKTASAMDGVSTSKASKKHSKTRSKSHSKASSKTSSKAYKSSSKTSSETVSPTASGIDTDGMATSTYPWPKFTKTCTDMWCHWFPTKTTLEAEDATMSSMVAEQYPAEERWHCMNNKCHSSHYSRNVVSTVKSWTPRPSSISTETQDAIPSYSFTHGLPPKSTVTGDNGM